MSDLDNLTAQDLACLGLHRADDQWSFEAIEREIDPDADDRALMAFAASSAALQRRERRERQAREIAVVKAVQKAGLPVRRAVIDGVDLEFGEPEAAGKAAPVTELDQWIAKHARHT